MKKTHSQTIDSRLPAKTILTGMCQNSGPPERSGVPLNNLGVLNKKSNPQKQTFTKTRTCFRRGKPCELKQKRGGSIDVVVFLRIHLKQKKENKHQLLRKLLFWDQLRGTPSLILFNCGSTIPGFLRWCRILSIHSSANMFWGDPSFEDLTPIKISIEHRLKTGVHV